MPTQQWREDNQEKMKAYRREWYRKNKDRAKARVQARKHELMAWFREHKKTLKCEQCGENHPACLDFHHRDGKEDGDLNISRILWQRGWSKARMLEELKKCDVLCANCHRKLHNPLPEVLKPEHID